MKILIAIDSFKGSMTSMEAGNAAEKGIKRCMPDAEVKIMPVADGGEGTVQALVSGLDGQIHNVTVKNPIGEDIIAAYGTFGKTAVIEMSAAAGITLIDKSELNPIVATTYGVGQIIADAINKGYRDFIVGIGGSATNDGGVGMLQALGFEFYDKEGNHVPFGARGLGKIVGINDENVNSEVFECAFNIACDVTNPLLGENGCSVIYGPQKGAKEKDIAIMDKGMKNYALVASEKYKKADVNFPGAGAAGGMGFAFMTFLNGKLKSGIDLILEKTEIEKYIKDADLVITGEGKIDGQTVMGKVPVGIARLAKKYGKPVIAFCGCATKDASALNNHGIDGIFPILRTVCTLEEAMNTRNAMENLSNTAQQIINFYKEVIK
ncbi:MAG: glycerate kinase [Clostridia bacterium]|nr:glycerate kinase [Clostridia bacterium]